MPDISIAIQRLSEILDHEQRCVDGLVALFRQEQEAIRLLASDELAASNQRKLALLTELRQLEEQRATLVAQLAADWGLPSESVTLTMIAGRIGAEAAGRLLRQQDRLNRSILDARDANDISRLLVAGSLALVEDTLAIRQGAPLGPPLYSDAGMLQAKPVGGALLARRG
ncbi:MAG: flagellar protein FlgN [Nitrospirae bacterium]|nr:MAG: flagellar protein FlgN [Nitrospirota bacterium]